MFVYGTVQIDLDVPGDMDIDFCLLETQVREMFNGDGTCDEDRVDLIAVEFELIERFHTIEDLVEAAQKESSLFLKGEGESFAIAGTREEARKRFQKGY